MLGEARCNLDGLLVIGRVQVEAHCTQRVFHEIHHCRAILLNETGTRCPNDHLRGAHRFTLCEQHPRGIAQCRIERERNHTRNQIDFLLDEHRTHVRETGFHDGHIGAIVQPLLAQHRPHGDIDTAARRVGGEHLALEIFHPLDRTIFQDEEFVGVIPLDPILKLIGDHPNIVHAGVLDRQCE